MLSQLLVTLAFIPLLQGSGVSLHFIASQTSPQVCACFSTLNLVISRLTGIENDFDRFETVGPFSSRDECTAKAKEMNAAAYSCDPKTN